MCCDSLRYVVVLVNGNVMAAASLLGGSSYVAIIWGFIRRKGEVRCHAMWEPHSRRKDMLSFIVRIKEVDGW